MWEPLDGILGENFMDIVSANSSSMMRRTIVCSGLFDGISTAMTQREGVNFSSH